MEEMIITHLMEENFVCFFLFWGFQFDFNKDIFLAPYESINAEEQFYLAHQVFLNA